MNLKGILKKYPRLFKGIIKIIRYLPFLNSIRVSNNNIVQCDGLIFKSRVRVNGINNELLIRDNAKLIGCKVNISGNFNKIYIGSGVYLENVELHIEDDSGTIIIDEKTIMSGKTHLAVIEGATIKIGKDCLFSAGITIRTGDSHSILDNNLKKRINASKNVTVEEHVWVGNGATILKGVVIKQDSIVATRAVVTKSPDISNCILGGNPAKVIKNNINWDATRIKMEVD